MICKHRQAELLRLDSGELSAPAVARVEGHLATCAACRTYREESRVLMQAAETAMPAGGPSPAVIEAILAQARDTRPPPVLFFRRPLMQVAAAAALLLVCLGGWSLWPEPRVSDPGISDIQAIMALMVDDADLGLASEASADALVMEDMAEALLKIQGLSTETLREETLWEPQATHPQSRNTRALPLKKYG